MNPDRYTKTVLTVIALCLLVIAGKNVGIVSTAAAADTDKPNFATVPVNEDGSLNVRVVGALETIDVNIESCDGNAFSRVEPLLVRMYQ